MDRSLEARRPEAQGPEALARSFYAVVAAGDEAGLRALLHPEWEMVPPAYPGQPIGPEGYLPAVRAFNAAFPDGRFEVHEVIAAPPKVTVRTTAHGTHSAPFVGREATGRTVAFGTIDVHEVEGGRIRRSWHIEDFLSFLQQTEG